jgi:hypothetical protein
VDGRVILNKIIGKIENDMDSIYLAHNRENGSVNIN